MARGKVKFYNESKGFGFIISNENGEEIFVHVTGLKDTISDSDEVEYDLSEGRKGPNAVNVRKI